jgi:hypothetical protein
MEMNYTFINTAHTLVRCDDDGATFEVEPHQHVSNVHGFAAERWRAAGCPLPRPYKPPVKIVDDSDRRRRREATDVRAR